MNYTDLSGLKPSPMEAAYMAQHIYDYDTDSSQYDRTIRIDGEDTGWRLIDVWNGREDMKMGFYIRGDEHSSYDGPVEYAIVFKGTTTIGGWKNILNRPYLSSSSADTWDAINYSKGFVESIGSIEVTFVGHSKGGQEAASAALATNKNAIIFNPAAVNANGYGLSIDNYSANMIAFIVEGEGLDVLNQLLGATPIDGRVDLPSDNRNPISKHHMEEVIKSLKEAGY